MAYFYVRLIISATDRTDPIRIPSPAHRREARNQGKSHRSDKSFRLHPRPFPEFPQEAFARIRSPIPSNPRP